MQKRQGAWVRKEQKGWMSFGKSWVLWGSGQGATRVGHDGHGVSGAREKKHSLGRILGGGGGRKIGARKALLRGCGRGNNVGERARIRRETVSLDRKGIALLESAIGLNETLAR